MNKLFGGLFISLLFISCEGNTSIKFSLLNNTSGALTVYHSDNNTDGLDTSIVTMGNSYMLYEMDLLGGQSQSFLPTEFIDTLIVVNANMDTMQKDFTQKPNWQNQIDELKKFPASWGHEYTLEIRDADF